MITTQRTPAKLTHRERAQEEFAKLLAAAESRGFFGTATITVTVQDGSIQHVKVAMERMIK